MNKDKSRRVFLKSGLSLGALMAFGTKPSWAQTNASLSDSNISTAPYLQSHFDNQMLISWISAQDAAAEIHYGLTPDTLNQIAYPESKYGLQMANQRLHQIYLKNLTPGQTYYYKTITKPILTFNPYALKYGEAISSAVYAFQNLDPHKENFEFYMLNDIHDKPNSITHLMQMRPKDQPDFVFFNGDIFDYQTDEAQIIKHFLAPCTASFAKHIPFLFVRGNHETRGKFARQFPNYFKEVGYAAFSLGPARLICIDTGEDKPDAHPVYAGIVDFDRYREEQALLLAQEINSKAFKNAKFKIVMMHIPPRFSGDWHGPLACTRLFEPLLHKGKVDLVLSGHTHEFKIHPAGEAENKYNLVIGGGPKEGERTLTRIQYNNKYLQVTVYNDSGAEIGKLEL